MKVILIDKIFKFSPSDMSQKLLAKIEIEVDNDIELMAVLKHLITLTPSDMIPKSGVQPKEGKSKLSVKKVDNENSSDNLPFFGPINSLEID